MTLNSKQLKITKFFNAHMDNPEIDQRSATGIFQYNKPKIITAIKNEVQTWTNQKIIPSPIKLFSPGAAV